MKMYWKQARRSRVENMVKNFYFQIITAGICMVNNSKYGCKI